MVRRNELLKKGKIYFFDDISKLRFIVFRYSFLWSSNYISIILWSLSKIMAILVNNVMNISDARKRFLAIFERTYYSLYICATFCGCRMSLSEVITKGAILSSPPKKFSPLKSQAKNALSVVWKYLLGRPFCRHPRLYPRLVRFIKLPDPNGSIWGFCEIIFKCSISYLLEYNDLTKVTAAGLWTNFTLVL